MRPVCQSGENRSVWQGLLLYMGQSSQLEAVIGDANPRSATENRAVDRFSVKFGMISELTFTLLSMAVSGSIIRQKVFIAGDKSYN